MKPAEYELKLIFVIIHGANYPKQPVYSNKWLVEEVNILYMYTAVFRTIILGLSGIIKPPKLPKTHMNPFPL